MDIKRSKRRRNRKIKFSEKEYIEKLYMKDGKAVIPVELEKPDDLYMEHDYLKRELSDSVCKYVEEIAYMIPINTDIIIEIHCPKVSKEMQDKMESSIKNNYGTVTIDENGLLVISDDAKEGDEIKIVASSGNYTDEKTIKVTK